MRYATCHSRPRFASNCAARSDVEGSAMAMPLDESKSPVVTAVQPPRFGADTSPGEAPDDTRALPSPGSHLRAPHPDLRAVRERRVEIAAPLRGQVQDVPDGVVFVDAAGVDVRGQPGMDAVEVLERAVAGAREDRKGRVLVAFRVLAAQVVLEAAVACAQQTQPVPAAC